MGAKKWKDEETGVELTIKEKNFCLYYVFGDNGTAGNASECYRKVYGMSEGTSDLAVWQYAHKIMKKPRVKEVIRKYTEEEATKEMVTGILKGIALDSKAKHADKTRAAELLGKSLGMFVDKSEVNIKSDLLFSENDEK